MSDEPTAFGTGYGFGWYPEGSDARIFVDRVATVNGVAIIGVRVADPKGEEPDRYARTPRLEIAVSRKGRSIRVWLDGRRMVAERDGEA